MKKQIKVDPEDIINMLRERLGDDDAMMIEMDVVPALTEPHGHPGFLVVTVETDKEG